MAKAIARYSEPVLEGVELTLTKDEAELLTEFLGATSIGVVEELLDWMTRNKQFSVNSVIYDVFIALNNTLRKGK